MPAKSNMGKTSGLSFSLVLLFILFSASKGRDIITQSQSLKDGQTLVSAGGRYVLGFFSPDNSLHRYVGIWFTVSREAVVWVANRDSPLKDSTGILNLDTTGNLVLTDKANKTLLSSLSPREGRTVAQLLDTGNLVVKEVTSNVNTDVFLWQSFDYPSDTLLAGMKVGPVYKTGRDRNLTSWRSATDPSPGDYTYKLDPRGLGQPFIYNAQMSTIYRSGPWNGLCFSGSPEMAHFGMFNFTVVHNKEESYYQFGVTKPGVLARAVMDETSGELQRLVWDQTTASWRVFLFVPKDECDRYAWCGPYGICDADTIPVCNCLPKMQPNYPGDWDNRNWKGGCERKTKLNCSYGDWFRKVQQVKLPDTVNSTVNASMSLGECRALCLKNCSCTAYASANVQDGSGCVIWTGDLVDVRQFPSDGQDLYLRLAASELDPIPNTSHKNHKVAIVATVPVLIGFVVLVIFGCCIWRRKETKFLKIVEGTTKRNVNKSISEEDPELPLFDFRTIASATDNFSNAQRIGKGGFGIVYKGVMRDGQEVAVKRQSSHSEQGVDEFKNEVTLIAKLQHRNLVRLLGCCVEGDERMLIYEYMPNKSLDEFIFGERRKRVALDWRKRLDIILGVARGLLYLHQDSRLRIIHRDLKAGNIVLDGAMNPKISDFGTARIFGNNQMEENTVRIVGTIGYMSPEYAMDGNFSEKSDVFSFGVLVLEIISGRKNRWISGKDSELNLLARAWRLWSEDRCLELKDDTLRCPCPCSEVLKCIEVGLLCVQESPDERPAMQQVLLMLAHENPTMPRPKKPGFFKPRNPTATDSSSSLQDNLISVNMITVTNLDGR